MSETPKAAPIVDPSPHAPPIPLGSPEYVFPPAAASPPEVLELKPNRAEDATEGPHPQVSQTTYVHMSKPDRAGDFLAPLANVEHYEANGFVKGAEEDIEDIGAYWSQQSSPKPATSTRSTSKTSTS